MGFDVAAGHVTAAPYFQSVPGDRNDSFVKRYKKRYGADEPTNMCAEAAYFQVHLFAKALALTQSMETDLIKQSVLGIDFEAPQGRVSINAATSHTDLWSRVGRVDRRGQFEIVQQSATSVWADPFLIGRGNLAAAPAHP
jgi:branched-chain amino acid transport system substrate-binding protein